MLDKLLTYQFIVNYSTVSLIIIKRVKKIEKEGFEIVPTVQGITAHHELLPAGRNPYHQPPPPPKTISIPPARKASAPTIIDADTVILDLNLSDWQAVEPAGGIQAPQSARENGWIGEADSYTPFFWRRALKAYTLQMSAPAAFQSTGGQVNHLA